MYGNITSTRIREGAPFARLRTEKKMGRTGFFRVNPVRPGSNRVGRVIPGQHGSTRVERVTSPGGAAAGHPERAGRSGHPTPYRQPGFFQCSLNPAHPGQPDQPGSTRKTPVRPIFFTVAKAVAQVGLTGFEHRGCVSARLTQTHDSTYGSEICVLSAHNHTLRACTARARRGPGGQRA